MKALWSWLAATMVGVLAAEAQQDFYRVYPYETPLAGWVQPALWTTYIPRSDLPYQAFGMTGSREGLWAHSAEMEFGFTDHLSLATYLDFEDPAAAGPRFTQARFEARYHFAQPYEHFFDYALDAEYYFPRSGYGKTQQFELRGIVQKDVEDFRLAVNPILSFDTEGQNAGRSPDAQLQAGIYYRRSPIIQPGFEFYSDFGQTGKWEKQRHVAMPVVDILLGRHWVWQLGAGRRVGGTGDKWVVESILQFRFDALRPTRWFRMP